MHHLLYLELTSLLCLGRQPSLYLPHPNIDIKLIVKLSPTQHPYPQGQIITP